MYISGQKPELLVGLPAWIQPATGRCSSRRSISHSSTDRAHGSSPGGNTGVRRGRWQMKTVEVDGSRGRRKRTRARGPHRAEKCWQLIGASQGGDSGLRSRKTAVKAFSKRCETCHSTVSPAWLQQRNCAQVSLFYIFSPTCVSCLRQYLKRKAGPFLSMERKEEFTLQAKDRNLSRAT